MKSKIVLAVIVLALLILPSLSRARAQSGDGYDLTWSTIDNGGGESVGSGYALAGTIGQPDAGVAMSGGGYTLNGGFWGTGASQHRVYLPVVIK